MGIKFFFKWFRNQFDDCIQYQFNNKTENSILCIDLNGIIHTSYLKILNQTFDEKIKDEQLFICIYSKIFSIYENSKSSFICICIDGVAPVAKQAQQRQRRWTSFINYDINFEKILFDSNSISPGTKFMTNLDKFLKNKFINDPRILFFSPSNESGEGEHKIINYILNNKNDSKTSFIIYSNDADIILLSWLLFIRKDNKITIMREENCGTTSFINVEKSINKLFKNIFNIEFNNSNPIHIYNRDIFIKEFAFLCMLIGNDFIPAIQYLDTFQYLNLILHIYKTLPEPILTFKNSYLNINSKAFINFLNNINEVISKMIISKHRLIKYKNSKNLDKLVENNLQYDQFNFEQYMKDYNKIKLKSQEKKISKQYIKTMLWTINYYTQRNIDWNWSYCYSYSPQIKDLIDCLKQKDCFLYKNPIVDKSSFGKPNHITQLMFILPPHSMYLLKEIILKDIWQEFEQTFKNELSQTYEIDLSGKLCDYEGIILLPEMSLEKIYKFVKKFE